MGRLPLVVSVIVGILGGCQPPPETALTAWRGGVQVVGTAEQSAPPALNITPERISLAWIGVGADKIEHQLHVRRSSGVSATVPLPVIVQQPRASRLFPAGGRDTLHLLWLDAERGENTQVRNISIDRTGDVFRGPLFVTEESARCFDALPQADGSLWVIAGGGTLANPGLYAVQIDPSGLPVTRTRLQAAAGCPAVVRDYRAAYVVWTDDDTLWLGAFVSGALRDPRAVTMLPDGGRLRDLRAGSDGERLYVFGTVTDRAGRDAVWFTSGTPRANRWGDPRWLGVIPDETGSFETTFNTGETATARYDEAGLAAAWAAPLREPMEVLPVAVEIDGTGLAMVYFQAGTVFGYQRLVDTEGILAAPELVVDRDRHLYLTWSEPTAVGVAEMRLMTTREQP